VKISTIERTAEALLVVLLALLVFLPLSLLLKLWHAADLDRD
jgi:hypothetical protein